MAEILVIGRITADLELKYGHSSKRPYVRFNLAEHIGKGDRARVQYYQVWAWNENALRLTEAGAKKGSLIRVAGSLELETYTKEDGRTTDKRLKVSLDAWDFVPVSNRSSAPAAPNKSVLIPPVGEIDGSKEPLPS